MSDVFAPEVRYAVDEINATFTGLGKGFTYPSHGEDEPGRLPEEYYSADFMCYDKALLDRVFVWCIENHERLNLHYVIANCRIWNVERAAEGIRRYFQCDIAGTDASKRHTNHVHTSFWEQGYYMPSLADIREVIREELARNNKPAAHAVWEDDVVPNVWGNEAVAGKTVRGKSALANIGTDINTLVARKT